MNLENINVVRWQQGQGFLLRPGAVPERLADDGVRLPENTFLVLPSDVVRNITVPVAAEEVKHLRRALPFMLEESLLEDVADLHFAHTPLDEGHHAVSVVARAKVAQWMDELPESLREVPWISEALCLPWTEGQWTLLFESDSVLVRWSEAEGTRVEATLLPALLNSLPAEQVVLVAYGQDEAAAMAAIPGDLRQ